MPVSRIASALRSVGRDMLNLCYPPLCASCEEPAEGCLCSACEQRLTQLQESAACERCAMPVAMEGSPCPWCEGKGLRPYHRVAVLGTYHDPLKEIIHRIKYHRRWAVAEKLADRLLHCPRALAILQETDVLVPVPLHALRQMRRGFNQADVIAQRLARRMKLLRVVRPVVRLRATETQTVLHGRSQRVKNLKHAFGLLDPSALAGKRVTVVDDVLTTGATLQSLARTLKPARPARLCALALAIADPEGRNFEMV